MRYIKLYEDFDNILHIFDLDDTLTSSISFSKLTINYLREEFNFKGELYKSLNKIGVDIDDLKYQDTRVYVDDPNHKIEVDGNWARKGQRVYMIEPYSYMFSDLSLPTKLLPTSNIYKECSNKAIVTARPISIKDKIEYSMKNLGLELPNYGLFMYDKDVHNRVGEWKGQKIVELIESTGFKRAIFYDDNSKYIKAVRKIVTEQLPHIDFKIVKV